MEQDTNATAGTEAGPVDYGPDFDGDVGAILKTRVLSAIYQFRVAEAEHTRLDRELTRIGMAWDEAGQVRNAAQNELTDAATAWEAWERQQLRNGPQAVQEGRRATEGADPLRIDVDAFMRP